MQPDRDAEWLEDRDVVMWSFREIFGRELDLENPQTFNEKIAYRILFDRRPLLTLISDKIRVRDYVAQLVGPSYLTRLYQTCRTPQQIDWPALPRSFVIKANHGAEMNSLIEDKSAVDREELFATLEYWLGVNYYYVCRREWAYRDVVPSLLIEEYLTQQDGRPPRDYKFYVFDGRALYLEVHFDRFSDHRANIYERNLKLLKFKLISPPYEGPVAFPPNIEEMFALADRLGRGLDFVRVDLYNIDGRIVFGELTCYPFAGLCRFDPPEYDGVFGAHWHLPASD